MAQPFSTSFPLLNSSSVSARFVMASALSPAPASSLLSAKSAKLSEVETILRTAYSKQNLRKYESLLSTGASGSSSPSSPLAEVQESSTATGDTAPPAATLAEAVPKLLGFGILASGEKCVPNDGSQRSRPIDAHNPSN